MTAPIKTDHSVEWTKVRSKCQRELVLKRIALGIIVAANFAALGTIFAYLTMYIPLSSTPLIVSPFILGVLGALTYLEFPTAGLTDSNFKQFTTPLILFARSVTLLLFAPIMLACKKIDWTNYADPFTARKIIKDFNEMEADKVILRYGARAKNLHRYGLISQSDQAQEFEKIYRNHLPLLEKKVFLEEENEDLTQVNKSFEKVKTDWAKWKNALTTPKIETALPDFSKTSTKLGLWIRKNFGLYLFA